MSAHMVVMELKWERLQYLRKFCHAFQILHPMFENAQHGMWLDITLCDYKQKYPIQLNENMVTEMSKSCYNAINY